MSLLVLGLNHRTAPLAVRERIVFDAVRLPSALAALMQQDGVREALIVSTCNRTELYCACDGAPAGLEDWLEQQSGGAGIAGCLYRLHGDDAIRHLFGVASGLDSLIIGEPQILGQLKDAYRAAQRAGTAGASLNRLFQRAFTVAKRVRTDTAVGASAVSVASAGVQLARRVFAGFEQHCALLVGAGDMVELCARHLHAQRLERMIIANRSVNRAQRIAAAFRAAAIPLDALDSHLPQADIVISSTASPQQVVGYEAVRAAVGVRRHRPMFMLDLAVPRDIDPRVATLEDVYLFTIDDLRQVVDENLRARQDEAGEARRMIDEEVARYATAQKTRDAVPLIRELRRQADSAREQTLEQARRMLAAGRDPGEVAEFLAATLTNRLLHRPSTALREAAERGDTALAEAVARLWRLDGDHS